MTRFTGTVELKVSMLVRDVHALIDHRWGSVAKLRAHLHKHPEDAIAVQFYRTATDERLRPDSVINFGETIFGDPTDVLAVGKLHLLGYLMGHPGSGVRELARGVGKNPATVLEQVLQLEEAGLVLRDSKGAGRPANLRPLVQELTIRVSPEPVS